MARPTVCLNMIVKNEAHVIYNCLNNLKHLIDTFVIVDTGSDDNTVNEILRFSSESKIKGEIIKHRFEEDLYFDFAKNRTYALEKCYGKSDYIFVFDADDLIEGDFSFPSDFGKHDVYRLRLKSCTTFYRPLIFRNDPSFKFKYICPIHEYLDHDSKAISYTIREGNYNVKSRRLGFRNKNPNKYEDDAKVLEKAIKETNILEKHYPRLIFYCAQSYRAANNKHKATELYWKRYNMENTWVQERYYSLLSILFMDGSKDTIYKMFKESEKLNLEREEIRFKSFSSGYFDDETIIKSFERRLPTTNIDSSHILFYHKELQESMVKWYEDWVEKKIYYTIKNFTRERNYQVESSFLLDKIVEKIFKNEDEDLMYLLADQNNDPSIHLKVSELYYKKGLYEKGYKNACNILNTHGRNIKDFDYAEKVRDMFVEKIMEITSKDHNYKHSVKEKDYKVLVTLTSCKRYDLMKPTLNSFFNCCEDLNLIDHFLCVDDNSSEEDRMNMKKDFPMFEYIMKSEDQKGHSISMNIIYDYAIENNYDYVFHMEDDWQFVQQLPYIQKCIDVLNSDHNYIQCIPNRNNAEIPNYQRPIGRGKYLEKPPHIVHEHYSEPSLKLRLKDDKYKNCSNISYWGSFTFHTGMWKIERVKELGHFSTDGFFEKDYAIDALLKGFKITFLDTFSYYNIGRKTWEPSGNNAYTINQVSQNSSREKMKIYVKTSTNYFDENWKKFKDYCYKDLKFRRYYGTEEEFYTMNDELRMLVPSYQIILENNNALGDYDFKKGFGYKVIDSNIIVCNGKVNRNKIINIHHTLKFILEKEFTRSYDIEGFRFVPYNDIHGNDICNIETPFTDDTPLQYEDWMKWIKSLSDSTLKSGGSSFNTFGYIKNSSENPNKNMWFHKEYHGIYIKL